VTVCLGLLLLLRRRARATLHRSDGGSGDGSCLVKGLEDIRVVPAKLGSGSSSSDGGASPPSDATLSLLAARSRGGGDASPQGWLGAAYPASEAPLSTLALAGTGGAASPRTPLDPPSLPTRCALR
jgi:hypothetical protein